MQLTLNEAQSKVDEWINQYGIRYFNELTNLALLMEEVGELSRVIARKFGEQSSKESEAEVNLGDEMADVFFVLLCLANQTGVNLTEAFYANLEKKTNRDNIRHRQNPKIKKNI